MKDDRRLTTCDRLPEATISAMSDVPAATFLNFIGGLAAQGLMQLGEIPNPLDGDRTVHLDHARYTLEVLKVLLDKTEGQRDQDEDDYLLAGRCPSPQGVLYGASPRQAFTSRGKPLGPRVLDGMELALWRQSAKTWLARTSSTPSRTLAAIDELEDRYHARLAEGANDHEATIHDD